MWLGPCFVLVVVTLMHINLPLSPNKKLTFIGISGLQLRKLLLLLFIWTHTSLKTFRKNMLNMQCFDFKHKIFHLVSGRHKCLLSYIYIKCALVNTFFWKFEKLKFYCHDSYRSIVILQTHAT